MAALPALPQSFFLSSLGEKKVWDYPLGLPLKKKNSYTLLCLINFTSHGCQKLGSVAVLFA